MEVHDLGQVVRMAPSPSATSPSGDDNFVPTTDYWPQDDNDMGPPPEPEIDPYDERRVRFVISALPLAQSDQIVAYILCARALGLPSQELWLNDRDGS